MIEEYEQDDGNKVKIKRIENSSMDYHDTEAFIFDARFDNDYLFDYFDDF